VNDTARLLHRRAAELTRGAYLPTDGNAPAFHVAAYNKESKYYRALPGGFPTYAAAEDAAAELHTRLQDAKDDLKQATNFHDYRYSPLHAIHFVPMTAAAWRTRLTPNGNRKN
jgi:hypothetical protein